MKFTVLFCLFLCVVAAFAETLPCMGKACNRKYLPFCGERVVDGKLERKIFSNYCLFQSDNICGAGYKECTRLEQHEK